MDILKDDNTSINANNDTLSSNQLYIPYHERWETYAVPAIFLIIFILGTSGNITTIFIICKEHLYNSPSFLFILNLAIGDLLVIIGTVPFIATIYTFESWPYGEFICKLSEFLRDLSICVTIFTLTMMSYDRYQATFSMRLRTAIGRKSILLSRQVKNRSITVLSIIWLVSIITSLPSIIFTYLLQVNISKTKIIYVCYPFPDNIRHWYCKISVLIKLFLLYLIPLVIIGICYYYISSELKKINQINFTKKLFIKDLNLKIIKFCKLRRKMVLFVAIFAICFFPNHLFMIWFYFNPYSNANYNIYWHILRIFGFVFTFLNSCLNPITLYLTSYNFRLLLQKYFCIKNHISVNKTGKQKEKAFNTQTCSIRKLPSSTL